MKQQNVNLLNGVIDTLELIQKDVELIEKPRVGVVGIELIKKSIKKVIEDESLKKCKT